MTATLSLPDQIRQLNDARKLVLGDASYLPTVVQSILPIIGPTAQLELRRWGADFLAEAFATPALSPSEKETMQLFALDTIQSMLENTQEDSKVVASLIQVAASIFPLTLKWTINNSYDTQSWQRMTVIKNRVLQIWTTAVPSVRLPCIKFAQRVILAQSTALSPDLRYGNSLDVSLDKIPQNHELLDHRTLEAEAMGLLDRMLTVLQDQSSDALIVDATLNCLSILIRTRPTTSGRILNCVLNFNPLKLANSPITPKSRVLIKSMEKTVRLLLMHLVKRDPHNAMNPKIHQHVERMMRMKTEILDDAGRKRALENLQQQHETLDPKRARVAQPVEAMPEIVIKPLAPGPHTLGEVFTLTSNEGLKAFNVSSLPAALVAKICVNTFARLDAAVLTKAVEGVRSRLHTLATAPPPVLDPNTAPLDVDEDDDDYEPDYAEDEEQLLNKLESSQPRAVEETKASPESLGLGLAIKSFRLPTPPPMESTVSLAAGNDTITRVLGVVRGLDDPNFRKPKAGFSRLAASSYDRESWITVLSRLAARAQIPLAAIKAEIKEEGGKQEEEEEEKAANQAALGDNIREALYAYVLEDFRKRIDLAVSWLSEEWYNDRRTARAAAAAAQGNEDSNRSSSSSAASTPRNYDTWTLKLIDGFVPYLGAQDKMLTRFLGEVPALTAPMLQRIKNLCRDPSLTQLALTSLLYLVMMRPPVRELALDTVQGIWMDFEDARPMAGKYLQKFRPGFIEAAKREAEATAASAAVAAENSPTVAAVSVATG